MLVCVMQRADMKHAMLTLQAHIHSISMLTRKYYDTLRTVTYAHAHVDEYKHLQAPANTQRSTCTINRGSLLHAVSNNHSCGYKYD